MYFIAAANRHFNKWSTDGSWETMWLNLLKEYKKHLDLSCVQLDGSHTRANRGGQAVGFQHRKSEETTNFLYLCDSQGILLAISKPICGNNHDLSNFKVHFEQLISWLEMSEISVDGLFLNADAGFDSNECKQICSQHKIHPNIAFNVRNGNINERFEYFDELLYKNRTVIERAFTWIDAFKALLARYETKANNWLCLNIIAMAICFVRKVNL